MGFDAFLCEYGLFLGFRRDFPKIHDNVDVVQVANEMKLCGVKNLSSTTSKMAKYSRNLKNNQNTPKPKNEQNMP